MGCKVIRQGSKQGMVLLGATRVEVEQWGAPKPRRVFLKVLQTHTTYVVFCHVYSALSKTDET